MKERFTNVAQKTLDVFVKFASTKAITALKDGFVLSMPITLVGSIFLLIANLPITGYTDLWPGSSAAIGIWVSTRSTTPRSTCSRWSSPSASATPTPATRRWTASPAAS